VAFISAWRRGIHSCDRGSLPEQLVRAKTRSGAAKAVRRIPAYSPRHAAAVTADHPLRVGGDQPTSKLVGLARSIPSYTQTVIDVVCSYLRRPFFHHNHNAYAREDRDPDRTDFAEPPRGRLSEEEARLDGPLRWQRQTGVAAPPCR
jgi:hypothetical protein